MKANVLVVQSVSGFYDKNGNFKGAKDGFLHVALLDSTTLEDGNGNFPPDKCKVVHLYKDGIETLFLDEFLSRLHKNNYLDGLVSDAKSTDPIAIWRGVVGGGMELSIPNGNH